jgi:hypothetical protein
MCDRISSQRLRPFGGGIAGRLMLDFRVKERLNKGLALRQGHRNFVTQQ